MKNFFVFLIIIGVIIGIVIGKNKLNLTHEEKEENTIEDKAETYELNLSVSDIDTLQPLRTQNRHIAEIMQLVYEPLFVYSFENGVQGVLVKEWEKRDDFSWIMKLRENVFWHGEEALTSEDIRFTIETILNPEVNSVYYANVKNIQSVEIIDKQAFMIHLQSGDPFLPAKLTFPIIPQYYYKNGGILDEEKANRPVGTGPYQFESNTDVALILKANNNWWKQNPIKLKKINILKYATYGEMIKGFKSSEIDMILTNMHNWKEKFGFIGINSYPFESNDYEVLIPNCTSAYLKDAGVRKAILQAINREDIVTNIYDDNASIRDIPIASSAPYVVEATEYNLEEARQLLIKAGWEFTGKEWKKSNKRLSLTLLVPETDEDKGKVAEKIKQYLNELSIPITIKKQKWVEFERNIRSGAFELALTSFQIENEYQLFQFIMENDENNFARFSNEEMNQIVEHLKTSAKEQYNSNMKDFIEMWKEEVPYVGLYFKNNIFLTNKSVKGQYESTFQEPYKNLINFSK